MVERRELFLNCLFSLLTFKLLCYVCLDTPADEKKPTVSLNKHTSGLNMSTQSKSKIPIKRSVHCKFNCVTVVFVRTQHGLYIHSLRGHNIAIRQSNLIS